MLLARVADPMVRVGRRVASDGAPAGQVARRLLWDSGRRTVVVVVVVVVVGVIVGVIVTVTMAAIVIRIVGIALAA